MASIQPRLYGFILKRLADREQTLEVLQRTNLVLCRKQDEFEPGSSFAAWAFTIAKFQVMAWRKSEGAQRLIFTDDVNQLLERSVDQEIESVDQRIPFLRHCMERLKRQDRNLIQERYRDGIPIADIANAASKSADAVAMQLSRIRAQLRDCVRMKLETEGQA
ncbi:sigma-70 family RNA polymerase sigma factor [Roseiconus nitratireducens]|nr:sigma-70 family RNA polymerase sigma factor [Roseiconus nitratireducens]